MALVRGDAANILSTALEEFRQALIRRWREHVTEAVLDGRDYPTTILAGAPSGYQPPWDYRHPHAQAHLIGRGQHCDYVAWINAGQEDPLESVVCAGTCEDTDEPEPIPPTIECGMYEILKPVDDWAWEERQRLFAKLPLLAHHDEEALNQAHDEMVVLAKRLALVPAPGSGTTPALSNPTLTWGSTTTSMRTRPSGGPITRFTRALL